MSNEVIPILSILDAKWIKKMNVVIVNFLKQDNQNIDGILLDK